MPRGLPVWAWRTGSGRLMVWSGQRVPWGEPVGLVLSLFIVLGKEESSRRGRLRVSQPPRSW